jgi:hypothetical protein
MNLAKFFSKLWVRIACGLLVFWMVFFMEIGTRTFFQHVVRILGTPEARELGSEIVASLNNAKNTVRRELGNRIRGAEPPPR